MTDHLRGYDFWKTTPPEYPEPRYIDVVDLPLSALLEEAEKRASESRALEESLAKVVAAWLVINGVAWVTAEEEQ